ncbi:uncharacterized protein CLAFUR5_13876 [Fulvia fulva]|uniref:Pentatricopeptide repeat protein n=1 Tax=Passalora fulva TaxID=5499 RepID=A0A9Q8UVP4_PASFU|nr:uncharacterized protein CLAFUR5_13876 [Fulvia fulva]KAK4611197.1 hypothetical protein CLAFUR0_14044 [Fulvia fulva]UJO24191.1 hypothetical protein CLAFUR5_13876 [Fulvia fulva]WPV36882.1 hypothetical protein CLAFUW7_14048 [Fulvia fulva]
MSLFGSLLKPQCLPAASIAARSTSVCTTSHRRPHHEERTHRRSCRGDIGAGAAVAGKTTASSIEDIFISSLLAAGTCREHRSTVRGSITGRQRLRLQRHVQVLEGTKQQIRHLSSRRASCQNTVAMAEPSTTPDISQEEYKELVNTYPSFPNHTLPPLDLARKAAEEAEAERHFPLASRLVLTPEQEVNKGSEGRKPLPPEDADHARQLDEFTNLLATQDRGTISHDKLWELFDGLRPPPLRYLSNRTVYHMFRHLSMVEYRTSKASMQRHLDLLSEAIAERIPLEKGVWNTAIHNAGSWVRDTTSSQVKAAIEVWMRMEESGMRANHVTLNILFLVAVKASRFALADTIYKELLARNLPLNRYFRTSVIHYAGMRQDGDGVRRAFRELVNAGELVDTVTMNSVILGLVRAGEAPAAENVFLRMKKLHEDKFGMILPEDWRARKELGRVLDKTGARLRQDQKQHESSFFGAAFSSDDKREQIQQATPIAPDSTTYRILIKHHAYTSGNINKTRELLAEMQGRKLPVHGSVYVHLLRGFHMHGGWANSEWSPASLEALWKEVLAASPPPPSAVHLAQQPPAVSAEEDATDMLGAMLAEQSSSRAKGIPPSSKSPAVEPPQSEVERPPYFTKAMAMAAIQAFYKCTDSRRMLEVWEVIMERWHDASDQDHALVQERVDRLAAYSRRRR